MFQFYITNKAFLVSTMAALIILPFPVNAQQLSGRGNTGNADISRIQDKLTTLQNQLDETTKALAAVNKCQSDGKFYRPSKSDADTNGCVSEDDPQVGTLSPNLVCTTDGQKVNCGYDLGAELAGMKNEINAVMTSISDIRQNVLPGIERALRAEFDSKLKSLENSLKNLLSDSISEILKNIGGIYAQLELVDALIIQNRNNLGSAFGAIQSANTLIRELLDRLNSLAANNQSTAQLGTPLYAKTVTYNGDWQKYNADWDSAFRRLSGNSQYDVWSNHCKVVNGQVKADLDPVVLEYCGRWICELHTGRWPFFARIGDRCHQGGDAACNNGNFYYSWQCLSQ